MCPSVIVIGLLVLLGGIVAPGRARAESQTQATD